MSVIYKIEDEFLAASDPQITAADYSIEAMVDALDAYYQAKTDWHSTCHEIHTCVVREDGSRKNVRLGVDGSYEVSGVIV